MEQLVEGADDEYVPAEQLEQTDADATENDPAAQAPVTAVKPVVAQYDPAVHAVHTITPDVNWKEPARQLEQTVAEAPE